MAVSAYKFFNNKCPTYMSEVFLPCGSRRDSTRNSYQKLTQPFRKTTQGQNSLCNIGPSVWNKLSENNKRSSSINSFKHNVKKHYFKELKQKYDLGLLSSLFFFFFKLDFIFPFSFSSFLSPTISESRDHNENKAQGFFVLSLPSM